MDYIDDKLKLAVCALLCCAFFLGFGTAAYAADSAALSFQRANKSSVELFRDPAKKKYRQYWLEVIGEYTGIAEKYPDSPFAPNALYKSAKLYAQLYDYAGKKSDLQKASTVYQQVARDYPDSSLADDALLNAGKIEDRLGNKAGAQKLYRRIVSDFSSGDMAEAARKKIKGKIPEAKPSPVMTAGKTSARGQSSSLSQVRNIRRWTNPGSTRVVIDLEKNVTFKAFTVPEDKKNQLPHRLVIDLKGAATPPGFPYKHTVDNRLVSDVRVSQHDRDTVRVVLDLKDKLQYNTFNLEDPSRIVIDVSNDVSSIREVASYQSKVKKVRSHTPSQMKDDVPSIATQLCLKVSRIVIDPGHGGKDPGAVSPNGVKEKDLVLEIGKLLAKRLKMEGFEVFLTRTSDVFLTLEERTNFANSKRADLFVSLHANSNNDKSVRGIETYFLNLTTDATAIEVAARENATTQKSISDLQLIINDLMLNSKINESSKFANCVHTGIISSAVSVGYEGRNLGVRQAPFYVLLGAQMPSILLELGFMTNSNDLGLMKRRAYQEALVDGIAKGINNYIMNTTYAYSGRSK
ncbi:MAG TPA: N-acetylmuramoyl-L-alanine amidase [Deltaproteobacteria bacterium]|nr:N-acetylmuramoyl-L-alanine amidase [Deltaproteobacteria bacterium]